MRFLQAAGTLRTSVFLLMGVASVSASGQDSAPLPNPSVPLYTNGTVYAIAHGSDGSTYFGGTFTSANGVPCANLARILPGGTVDAGWTPQVNGGITALAYDGAGMLFIGGGFTFVNGQPRTELAKISATGSGVLDLDWNVDLWDPYAVQVKTILDDGAGSLFVGGKFVFAGAYYRTNLAKIATAGSGAVDASWAPNPNNSATALALSDSGSLFVAGNFGYIAGVSRSGPVKLATTGTGALDVTWNTGTPAFVNVLALDGGYLYIAGTFTDSQQAVRKIGRLDATGTGALDESWRPSADGEVNAVIGDGSGAIYAGGGFSNIGGQARGGFAKLSAASGAADTNWHGDITGGEILVLSANSNRIFAGGRFTSVGDQTRLGMAILSTAGDLDPAIDAEYYGRVSALAAQPGGAVIVGGNFYKVGAVPRRHIFRLAPDGSLDPVWDPGVGDFDAASETAGVINSIAVDSTGTVYAGGWFPRAGGATRANLAKFDGGGDGSVNPDWQPSTDNTVQSLTVNAAGVYVGGFFLAVDGQERFYIAKVSLTDGAIDATWYPASNHALAFASDNSGVYGAAVVCGEGAVCVEKLDPASALPLPSWTPQDMGGEVEALTLDAHGALYAGGWFMETGGELHSNLAKFTNSGAVASDWQVDANAGVLALVVDASGTLYAGGDFTQIGGQARSAIAKIRANGTVDPDWSVTTDIYPQFRALADNGKGVLYAGGSFTTINGQVRTGLVAFRTESIFKNGFD